MSDDSQNVSVINTDGTFGDGFKSLVGEEYAGHDEIKNAGNIQTFVKNHMNLVKKLGEKTEGLVKIPGEDASDDDRAAFRKAWGVPESADGYELERPQLPEGMEYDETLETGFKGLAHEIDLNPIQAAKLHKFYNDYMLGINEKMEAAGKKSFEEGMAAIKIEANGDIDGYITLSQKGIKAFADEDFVAYLEETKLGNHPAMIKFGHKIAEKISEDSFVDGNQKGKQTNVLQEIYGKVEE